MTLFLPILAFAFASMLVLAAAMIMSRRMPVAVKRRMKEITVERTRYGPDGPAQRRAIVRVLRKIGDIAPKSPSELTKLQRRLVSAGYRGPEAVKVFIGIRLACAVTAFLLVALPVLGSPNLPLAFLAAVLAYVVPAMLLARLAKRRQHRIRLSLPDALDLLVVSVEAGLGLDQAMLRVGEELSLAHPDLSDELRLVNLELRAGKDRVEALRNLAERTDVDDLASLVAILVQTDKFGTSVAQALRVHSDTLRTKRRQRAEEAAAKTGVKMVFPLVFCIFPSIYVVTLGPAAIKIIDLFGKMGAR